MATLQKENFMTYFSSTFANIIMHIMCVTLLFNMQYIVFLKFNKLYEENLKDSLNAAVVLLQN